jgi:endonuclease/exonuclease/phosphatase family metal-dependent hydrolase
MASFPQKYTRYCRRSSVVEHTLGKGEVESSILFDGTIKKKKMINRGAKKVMVLKIILACLVLVPLIGVSLIYILNYFPKPVEPALVRTIASNIKPSPKSGDVVKFMTWNVQYGASTKYHFFYEGGEDVYVKPEDVNTTLQEISKQINSLDPDIVYMQEIDLKAYRTNNINQFHLLQDLTKYPYGAYVPQWKSKYFPIPSGKHVKNVDTGIVILSKFPISNSLRYDLPQIQSMSALDKAFYLNRAVLGVDIPLENGKNLKLYNTHLDAFSMGDNTMALQIDILKKLMESARENNDLFIMAGDFNLVPPHVDPSGLKTFSEYYPAKDENPIKELFETYKPALTLSDYMANPVSFDTYLNPKETTADRWLDHAFVSTEIEVLNYKVWSELNNGLSDHHPVTFDIKLP